MLDIQLAGDQGRVWPPMSDAREASSWNPWAWRASDLKRHSQRRRMWHDKHKADLRMHTPSFFWDNSTWLQDDSAWKKPLLCQMWLSLCSNAGWLLACPLSREGTWTLCHRWAQTTHNVHFAHALIIMYMQKLSHVFNLSNTEHF